MTTETPPTDGTKDARRKRIEELAKPKTYGAPDLRCDLIMKGGITSGVVYPLAVAELATTYRFCNIGGTSAGAIAAAGTAAAAHNPDTGAGFALLAELPDRLGGELESMFRPQRKTRRLFRLALLATAKASGGAAVAKWARLLLAALAFAGSVTGLVLIGGTMLAAVILAVPIMAEVGRMWWTGPVVLVALLVARMLGRRIRAPLADRSGIVAALAWALSRMLLPAVIVVAALLWQWSPFLVISWILAACLLFVVGIVAAIAREAGTVLPENDFGMVGGSSLDTRSGPVDPLSEWLDDLLRQLSGNSDPLAPLTFGQLRNPDTATDDPGPAGDENEDLESAGDEADDPGPAGDENEDLESAEDEEDDKGINLMLLTTCLSQGRTYHLPADFDRDEDDRLEWFFDPLELRRTLPDNIIAYLCAPTSRADRERAHAALRQGEQPPGEPGKSAIEHAAWPFRPLPDAEDLPVLLATRMSLSFPLLISAVPLRSIDWTLKANAAAIKAWDAWIKKGPANPEPKPVTPVTVEKCWFSDGGIISNFPIHLFDSLTPRHPTFGINLRGYHPDRIAYDTPTAPEEEKVFRPVSNGSGAHESWSRWPDAGWAAIGGFAGALKNTMQNWSDNDQMRTPGYRDRVVHVSHNKTEGGLNLAMPAPIIDALGRRGHAAAQNLIEAFSRPEPPTGVRTGWRNHKWIRFRTAMALLGAEIQAVDRAYDEGDPVGVESYQHLVRLDKPPSYPGIKAQRKTMQELVEGHYDRDDAEEKPAAPGLRGAAAALDARARIFEGSDLKAEAPGPLPQLRVTPGHREASE